MDETVKMRFEWLLDDTNPDVRILLKAVHERDARIRELKALVKARDKALMQAALWTAEPGTTLAEIREVFALARMGGEHDRS